MAGPPSSIGRPGSRLILRAEPADFAAIYAFAAEHDGHTWRVAQFRMMSSSGGKACRSPLKTLQAGMLDPHINLQCLFFQTWTEMVRIVVM